MNTAIKLIQPATVQRDKYGSWYHPDLPDFAGTDEATDDSPKYEDWRAAQGLEVSMFALENEDEHPAHTRYFDEGDPDFHDWDPKPEGDGWFMLAIGDTEDGPCATFVRRTNAQ